MEGKLNAAAHQGFRLTVQQWHEVEHELNLCLKEHRISAEQYLAAMTQIKTLTDAETPAPQPTRRRVKRRTENSRPASV
jgi:hypothetical protein